MNTNENIKTVIKKFLLHEDGVNELITKEPLIVQYYIIKAVKTLKNELFLKYFAKYPNERNFLDDVRREIYNPQNEQDRLAAFNGFPRVKDYVELVKEISNSLPVNYDKPEEDI